jgi:prepilin-type N-terminal cleavage/methylation domain-containing protein
MKKSQGLTLIELIVSMVIFGIVIIGVTIFNSHNSRAAVKSERRAKMMLLEEQAIEEFKGWLKSASVPGTRFDNIWADNSVGDVIWSKTDDAHDIDTRLEIEAFFPDQSNEASDVGVRLMVKVVSEDGHLDVTNENIIYISRHD